MTTVLLIVAATLAAVGFRGGARPIAVSAFLIAIVLLVGKVPALSFLK